MGLEILLTLINTLLAFGQEFCDIQYEDHLLNAVFNVENDTILGCRSQADQQLCWRFVWSHNNKLIPKQSNIAIDFTGYDEIKCGFTFKPPETDDGIKYGSLVENTTVVFSEQKFWIIKFINETSYRKVDVIDLYNHGFRLIFGDRPKHKYVNDNDIVFGNKRELTVRAIAMKMMKTPRVYAIILRRSGPKMYITDIINPSTYVNWTDFKSIDLEYDAFSGAFHDLHNNIQVLYNNHIYQLINNTKLFDDEKIVGDIGRPNSTYFPCYGFVVKPKPTTKRSVYNTIIVIMIAVIILLAILICIALLILDIKSKRKKRIVNDEDETIRSASITSGTSGISGSNSKNFTREDSIANITESEIDK